MNNQNNQAFTLLEIIIVVTIVLILATAAVSQTGSVQQLLKFNNVFQQTVFFVQRARTMALTQREDAPRFGVDFSTSNSIQLFKDPAATVEETFQFPSGIIHHVTIGVAGGTNCPSAQITFDRETARTRFSCTGIDEPLVLQVTLCQLTSGSSATDCASAPTDIIRSRSFVIHRAAGVPQF